MYRPLLFLGVVSMLALLTHPGASQKKPVRGWKLDPYTMGDVDAMRRAGYVSYGPFPWGDDHGSRKIHEMMPEAKILWVETEHFRIGSSLASLPMPKASKSRKRVIAELKLLKTRLPKVKPTPRKLDRWLRLHMYARRLENLYEEWEGLLRVTDASFPKENLGALPAKRGVDFMGVGPYLGMGDKYPILLLQKASNLTRYASKCGQPQPKKPTSIFVNFLEQGSMLFGTSAEIVYHSQDTDHRLHVHIRFNVSQLLLRGYKYYTHSLPSWIEEGVANSLVIQWDPTQHDFSDMSGWDQTKAYPNKWAVNCRRLATNGFASGAKRLCAIRMAGELTFNDQMCSWSRIDFLRKLDGGEKFAKFLALLKSPLPSEPGKVPVFETVLGAQEAALKEVFGMGWDEFDAAWKKYAVKNYPKR